MELLVEAAKQVPALAVLVWLVYYMNASSARQQEMSENRLERLIGDVDKKHKELSDRVESARESVQEALIANTSVLGGISVILDRIKKDTRESKREPRS